MKVLKKLGSLPHHAVPKNGVKKREVGLAGDPPQESSFLSPPKQNIQVRTWCPSQPDVETVVLTLTNVADKGATVKGKPIHCNLEDSCKEKRVFCWLRADQIETAR